MLGTGGGGGGEGGLSTTGQVSTFTVAEVTVSRILGLSMWVHLGGDTCME